MNRTTALLTVAVLSVGPVAFGQDLGQELRNQLRDRLNGQPQQQTQSDQARQQQGQTDPAQDSRGQDRSGRTMSNDMERQEAQRPVQIRESVIYGLSDEPREKLYDAVEKFPKDADKAAKCVMVAAKHLELFAAVAQSDNGSGQDLRQASQDLLRVAERIQNRELLDIRDAKKEFAQALFTLADTQQKSAQAGLVKGNEKQTGYTLKSAAENLTAALTYGRINPDQQLSQAIYNAETSGKQLISLDRPTTYQNSGQRLRTTPEGTTNAQPSGALDQARQAGERLGQNGALNNMDGQSRAGTIGSSVTQSVQDLGQAIQSVRTQVGQISSGRSSE